MSEIVEVLRSYKRRGAAFEDDAHQLLARYEGAKSRVFSLRESHKKLAGLSLLQDELFKQSFHCIEQGIYRAAIVMAWAAFIDFLEHKLAEDGLIKVMVARPAWTKWKTVEELRENVVEHQLIEVARELRLLSKAEVRILQGHLSKRNECAHPSPYRPDLNDSLGYVSELLARVETLSAKSL